MYRCGISGHGLVDMVLLGGWLDLMILEVFSNLWFYDSMTLANTGPRSQLPTGDNGSKLSWLVLPLSWIRQKQGQAWCLSLGHMYLGRGPWPVRYHSPNQFPAMGVGTSWGSSQQAVWALPESFGG